MTEKIAVEWIATAASMTQALDKITSKLDRQEKLLEKTGATSVKANNLAIGSYARLERELKQNEAALKRMAMGSKAYDDQRGKVDALRKSLAGAKDDLNSMGSESAGMVTSAIGSIGQLAAGFMSVQVITSAILGEMEKMKELRLEAASQTRSVEASFAKLAQNLGENAVPAKAMIAENAPKLGVSQEGLANLFSAAISGGAKDLNEALELSAMSLKMTGGDAASAGPIMSGVMTLAATTDNRDFKSVLGQLRQFQEAARGEDLAVSINNMSTAMAAANTKGDRIEALGSERTLEMASVMSQTMQDPTMAVTGTALRQMVQKMDSFVAHPSAKMDDGTVSSLQSGVAQKFNALKTMDERVSMIRENPEIGKQFLDGIEENQSKVAIREIVKGTDRVKGYEADAARIITPKEEAAEALGRLTDIISGNTQLTQAENISQSNLQSVTVGSDKAMQGQVEKILSDTLDSVNLEGFDMISKLGAMKGFELSQAAGYDPIQSGKGILKAQRMDKNPNINERQIVLSPGDLLKIDKQIALLERMALAQEAAAASKPIRVQAPAARPKEAPLPAATIP